ncbi:uncharacterized protein LAESUDRAFT_706431 [Laetiporus sulphureus 93-53]|uniref:Uncharacterized protein n=1 Tax=Laetiporus sulphureus 93-53 TaxID=1314785 RepID=A0A165C8G6_9APHY|nr:uncharacterized protein LAESUDRAFT_706431 [Laetiporus sulphureus 93-53]KZT02383.1 hypothetical protein LAESUDRAFT_706431 [Laetiporus sulphureus 93-53]
MPMRSRGPSPLAVPTQQDFVHRVSHRRAAVRLRQCLQESDSEDEKIKEESDDEFLPTLRTTPRKKHFQPYPRTPSSNRDLIMPPNSSTSSPPKTPRRSRNVTSSPQKTPRRSTKLVYSFSSASASSSSSLSSLTSLSSSPSKPSSSPSSPNSPKRLAPPRNAQIALSPEQLSAARTRVESSRSPKCPVACGFVQKRFRPQDMLRHVETHLRASKGGSASQWVCRGVPEAQAARYLVKNYDYPNVWKGVRMVGGCMGGFSRRDALARHLKNNKQLCVGDFKYLGSD